MIESIISTVLSNKENSWRKESGQTLIEVIAALSAAVVIVSASAVAVINALKNAQFSNNQNLATRHAQEGIEVMRDLRNSNYAAFSLLQSDTYCLRGGAASPSAATEFGCGQNVGIFVREVDIEKNASSCGGNLTKVSTYVSWSDSKCTDKTEIFCHLVALDTCLSDYHIVPTP